MNKKIFPLFFIVERVNKGYVLTFKNNDSMEITKEVVLESNINTRIGELLSLETLTKGRIAKFHVEATAADHNSQETKNSIKKATAADHIVSSNDPANFEQMDELFTAKVCFYNNLSQDIKDGSTLVLQDKDDNLNEIFGENAKEVALKHELPLAYKNDIASISFPTTKEGQKSLAQCIQRVKLVAFTHQELLQWYHSNKL